MKTKLSKKERRKLRRLARMEEFETMLGKPRPSHDCIEGRWEEYEEKNISPSRIFLNLLGLIIQTLLFSIWVVHIISPKSLVTADTIFVMFSFSMVCCWIGYVFSDDIIIKEKKQRWVKK